MIYVVFWYLILVRVLSTVCRYYEIVVAKTTNGGKVGALIGTTFKFTVFVYFYYVIYPLLSLVK